MKGKLVNKCFFDQNDDEDVILVVRRSFIIDLPWLIFSILLIIFLLNFKEFVYSRFNFSLDYPLVTFIEFSLAFFILIFILNRFLNWFYTVNIITNQRIVDMDYKEIGDKSIVEAQIKNIQSLTVKNTGFLSFLFGLSTLQILTAGDNPNIEFDYISDSAKIYDLISDLTRQSKEELSEMKGVGK